MSAAATSVNSIEPVPGPAPQVGSDDQSRPIVSVNAGPRPKQPIMFWLFVSAGVMVIIGLSFLVLSRINIRQMILPEGATAPPKQQGTPIDPPDALANAKPFDVTTDAEPAQPTVSVASAAGGRDRPCVPRPVKDPTGAPIVGSDGKPMMLNCDGTSMPATTTPTVSIAGAVGTSAAGAGTAVPAVLRHDRYGGPIKNEKPAAAAGELSPEAKEALEVLRRADAARSSAAAGDAPTRPQAAGPAGLPAGLFGAGGTSSAGAGPSAAAAAPGAANSRNLARVSATDETPRHLAKRLDKARWVALRGSQIECNLTLAYVSDIAGEAHCVVARDVYGQDGSTILIDRGSVANGSFQAVAALGERRAYVIWERLVTPGGVVVALASKGTDALGSTGIPAKVDNRWLDRIGVALAISLVKDASTAVAARHAASGSQFASTSQEFGDQVLAQTIAIRPSLYVKQGSTASMVLQGDLDFSGVYALR